MGLGLTGTLLAQASRTLASSIAITGAGYSVYSTFIARGEDVVLPANTPLTVSIRGRGGEAGVGLLWIPPISLRVVAKFQRGEGGIGGQTVSPNGLQSGYGSRRV